LTLGTWLDVGFGNASLLFTAQEWGFVPVGLDLRRENVESLLKMGVEAHCRELASLQGEARFAVISMADVLEHMPFPRETLTAARRLLGPDGVLFLSMPHYDCAAWRLLDAANANPYWGELEHFHNFTRKRLYALLEETGFEPVAYGVSERYRVCMEVLARPATTPGSTNSAMKHSLPLLDRSDWTSFWGAGSWRASVWPSFHCKRAFPGSFQNLISRAGLGFADTISKGLLRTSTFSM
jgi:SAM-dependent methyltransferase